MKCLASGNLLRVSLEPKGQCEWPPALPKCHTRSVRENQDFGVLLCLGWWAGDSPQPSPQFLPPPPFTPVSHRPFIIFYVCDMKKVGDPGQVHSGEKSPTAQWMPGLREVGDASGSQGKPLMAAEQGGAQGAMCFRRPLAEVSLWPCTGS